LSLNKYWEKRNFEKTSEPKGEIKSEEKRIYVIQKHAARRLHYDLRLEMDGVLKSWAIPKEPPTSIGIKRLAIEVEDHPIEYANFEGCFEFYTKVITEEGNLNIGNIVNEKKKVKCLSYNFKTHRLEWKPIIGWFCNGKTINFLRIRVPGQYGGRRIITVTPNHKIFTPNGIKFAKELKVGDSIFIPGIKWSDEQFQVLIGTLLGDAHLELSKETKIPCYQLTHSSKQKSYLEFVRDILAPHAKIHKRKNSNSWTFRFTHIGLVNIYPKFYRNKVKIVSEEVLSLLDERGLAIWYMDNGYLLNKYVEFSTQGFTKEENNLIVEFLRKKWQINAKVYYKKRKKGDYIHFIHLDKISSMRFLTLVNPYILPELRYKTYLKPCKLKWKFEKGKEDIIPVKIVSIEKAPRQKIRSQKMYDIQVEGNNNYFAGSMLVSNSIPEGEYGAGTVEIWDKGNYKLIERKEDKIVIEINGKKLNGLYVLIRMKKSKNWLFFKKK
jgi:DNA ligase D-like protein (predicted 3'-phosphoesterase)